MSSTWGNPLWGDAAFVDPGTGASSTGGGIGGGTTSAPHIYWRLSITSCDEGSTNKPPSIAEWKFYDSSGTQIPTTGGSATASHFYTAGREADKAFDGDNSTYWDAGVNPSSASPQWLQYQFPSPVAVDHFTITNRPDGVSYGPVYFSLQSSDDGGTWTTAWTYEGASGWDEGSNITKTFYTTGIVWRLLITATQGGSTNVTIADQRFFDGGAAQISTATGTALGSSDFAVGPQGEPDKAFAGSCSLMWRTGPSLAVQTPAFLGFHFPAIVNVASLSFRSTTDAPSDGLSESPSVFALQSSVDGANWTTVQSFTAAPWITSCQTQTFSVGLTGGTASIAIDPAQGFDGSRYSITVTGTDTHFTDGVTAVTISGAGATISNVVISSATSLSFTLALAPNAVIGERTVTTATGSEAPTATFTVLPIVVTGRKRGDIGWSQIREGLDGIWGFGPYGVATDGSFLAGDVPVVGPDGATLVGSGQGIAFIGGGGAITVNQTATVQINGASASVDDTVLVNGA